MFEKLIGEIKHYKNSKFDREAYLYRIKSLPRKYQIVYNGISDYMWLSDADSESVMGTLFEILAAFEDGVRDNKDVFNITGNNVIEFTDNLLLELHGKTWIDKMKDDKNNSILKAVKRMDGE